MKPSVDTIITEFALRAFESQDHELFMRRVANAMNGFPKESMFFGRITHYTLKSEKFLPDLFSEAKKSIWSQFKRESAVMTAHSFELTENNTAICACFKYEATNEDGKLYTSEVYLTIHQDDALIDAFDITVD